MNSKKKSKRPSKLETQLRLSIKLAKLEARINLWRPKYWDCARNHSMKYAPRYSCGIGGIKWFSRLQTQGTVVIRTRSLVYPWLDGMEHASARPVWGANLL